MPVTVHELKGSGDFSSGPTGTEGELLYLVLGAASQSEAYDAVDTATYAPTSINSIPRGSIRVEQQSKSIFRAKVEYSSNVKPDGEDGTGLDPGAQGNQPGGGNPVGANASQELGPEFNLTTGGGTERIYFSKETVFSSGRDAAAAPNFNRMIGVPLKGGKAEGCEIYAAKCEFSLARKFQSLELGYALRMMATTAKTNSQPYLGCAPGEVLFLGGDIHSQLGASPPWSINGRFGYSPNRYAVGLDDEFSITIPELKGWDYLWVQYEETPETIDGAPYIKTRPKFAYVERVYDEEDLSVLRLHTP